MIAEERHVIILNMLEKKRTMTVPELSRATGASPSTIRRDLGELSSLGLLRKVHGGAVANESELSARELTVDERNSINIREKEQIGRYAAGLIRPDDFVFIDSGTTTGMMVEFIEEKNASYVTNSVMHARRLARRGCRVYMTGGELKASTEALVGATVIESLRSYHFTRAFMGTNAVSLTAGFTTPDPSEAIVKRSVIEHARKCCILCDHSKFDTVSSVCFCPYDAAVVITDRLDNPEYARRGTVIETEIRGV